MINAHAYGVREIDSFTWMHYWIDENFAYRYEVKNTPDIQNVSWVKNKFTVKLFGPGDFIVTQEK